MTSDNRSYRNFAAPGQSARDGSLFNQGRVKMSLVIATATLPSLTIAYTRVQLMTTSAVLIPRLTRVKARPKKPSHEREADNERAHNDGEPKRARSHTRILSGLSASHSSVTVVNRTVITR